MNERIGRFFHWMLAVGGVFWVARFAAGFAILSRSGDSVELNPNEILAVAIPVVILSYLMSREVLPFKKQWLNYINWPLRLVIVGAIGFGLPNLLLSGPFFFSGLLAGVFAGIAMVMPFVIGGFLVAIATQLIKLPVWITSRKVQMIAMAILVTASLYPLLGVLNKNTIITQVNKDSDFEGRLNGMTAAGFWETTKAEKLSDTVLDRKGAIYLVGHRVDGAREVFRRGDIVRARNIGWVSIQGLPGQRLKTTEGGRKLLLISDNKTIQEYETVSTSYESDKHYPSFDITLSDGQYWIMEPKLTFGFNKIGFSYFLGSPERDLVELARADELWARLDKTYAKRVWALAY